MKTLETFKKTVTKRYQTEIIEVSPDLLLIVHKTDSKITSEILIEKKYCKIDKKKQKYYIKPPKKEKDIRGWHYYSPAILDEIKTKHFTDIDTRKLTISPLKELKKHGKINKKQILCFDYSSHLVYQYGKEAPLSGIYIFDYIGGVNDEYFHIAEAFKHLQKRKQVLKVELQDIPYYNRSLFHTQGLFMKVLLPQTVVDKLWNEVNMVII